MNPRQREIFASEVITKLNREERDTFLKSFERQLFLISKKHRDFRAFTESGFYHFFECTLPQVLSLIHI